MVDFQDAIELARRVYKTLSRMSKRTNALDDLLVEAARFLSRAGIDPTDISVD